MVGPSGGGKTTVSRLAARFWDATSGNITVGGMNISNVEPETLLSLYSIVFQDVTLFNTSVAENIRLGKKGATDEEVLLVYPRHLIRSTPKFSDVVSISFMTASPH